MSGPFSAVPQGSQPVFKVVVSIDGGFTPFPAVGIGQPEIGYGQEGYGIGGYDAPAISIQSAPTPNWTAETTK